MSQETFQIQAAIDYSIDGDSILVAAGTYYENINFNGKSISVIGEDRETTIIDGSQNGSVVVFDSEETISSILRGFTIQNGHANGIDNYSFGGGIFSYQFISYLEDLIVQNNFADYGGINFYGSFHKKNSFVTI